MKSIAINEFKLSKTGVIILATLAIFILFMAGYDQGHLFSIVQGSKAFDELYIHELFHDMRHAAGFPCH
ncbi:MAG: CbtB domain-containing protein [Candidatus Nitrosocaldaceae archaeon]